MPVYLQQFLDVPDLPVLPGAAIHVVVDPAALMADGWRGGRRVDDDLGTSTATHSPRLVKFCGENYLFQT